MKLARVIGSVVATQKHPAYRGRKTILVQPVDLDGADQGPVFVAVDTVQAGAGDLVLLLQEGSSARLILGDGRAPVRSVIVGIVDEVNLV